MTETPVAGAAVHPAAGLSIPDGARLARGCRGPAGRRWWVGYLLKDRVSKLAELSDPLRRVAGGGTLLDPEVVSALLTHRRRRDPLDALSPREREVLGLMAEGRTNTAIGRTLVITPGAVEKHISSIFDKLGLPPQGTTIVA